MPLIHYQSAYRKLHSAETALCKIHDDLVSNTCHGKTSILVLLDLSASFDTVDHQLLLSDFSDCGFEGTAMSLLESYLENRKQCVAIGESRSEPTALQYGVPQGSVLGHLDVRRLVSRILGTQRRCGMMDIVSYVQGLAQPLVIIHYLYVSTASLS